MNTGLRNYSNSHRSQYAVFGAGGMGREIATMIELDTGLSPVIVDDKQEQWCKNNSVPWVAEKDYNPKVHGHPVLSFGDAKLRRKVANALKNKYPDITFPPIVSKHSLIGNRVNLGAGVVVMQNCIITCDATIEDFVQLNICTTIAHDTRIGSYVTTAPGVHINGNVTVEEDVYFGSNSCTVHGISIVAGTVIGAGATVTKTIQQQGTYVGVPAKLLQKNK